MSYYTLVFYRIPTQIGGTKRAKVCKLAKAKNEQHIVHCVDN